MTRSTLTITLALLAVLGLYLFHSAPPPLPENGEAGGADSVPIENVFRLLAAENAATRSLFTAEIVGAGATQGLRFREDWKQREVQAGPLPALFLREVATLLQRDVPGLSLFLGSDQPIVAANRFKGEQVRHFERVRAERQAQFFQDPSTRMHTAMFPDLASAKACVSCHNEHDHSPKRDWALNDVMGATTWMYPRRAVSTVEALAMLAAYRRAVATTYGSYLRKVEGFAEAGRPRVGAGWPRDGAQLPSVEQFMQAVHARNAGATLQQLLAFHERGAHGTAR